MNAIFETLSNLIAPLLAGGSGAWWLTRRSARRNAEIDAERNDLRLSQELLTEIKDKTRLIRELNEERLSDARKIHDLEMALHDTECSRRDCAFRRPRKPFTPAPPTESTTLSGYFEDTHAE